MAKKDNWDFNLGAAKQSALPEAYGFGATAEAVDAKKKKNEIIQSKMNKAKSLIMEQAKSIFITFISSFFIGRNLSLFTIFIYGFYAYNSIKGILGVNQAFKMIEGPEYSLLLHKIIYVLLGSVSFGILLYKIYGMGLIPLNPSDWVSLLEIEIPDKKILT